MHKARSGAINSQAELLALQKRARRRLVIACVITFISVSVMWRVRETVPRDVPLPESVVIVGDNLPADLVAAQAANETPPQPNEPIEGVVTTPAASATAGAKPAQPQVVAQADSAARDRATEEADAAPQPLPPSAVTPVTKLKESSPHSGAIKPAENRATKSEPKPEPKPEKSTPVETKPTPHREPAAILNDSAPRSSSSAKESSHDAPSKKLPNKDPDPAPTPKKPEKSEPSSGGRRYTVQVAALSDDAKAQDLKNKLMAMGVSAQITQVETSKGHINRIRTGSFSSEEEARKVLARIQQAGVSGIIVNQ